MKRIYIVIIFSLILSLRFIYSQTTCIEQAKSYRDKNSAIKALELCISNLKEDTIQYIKSTCYLSKLLNRRYQFNKAERKLYKLIPLVNSSKNEYLKGLIYNHLAYTYSTQGEKSRALKSYLTALKYFEISNTKPAIISVNTDLSEFNRSIGNYIDARKYLMNGFNLYNQFQMDSSSLLMKLHNRYAAVENERGSADSSIFHSIKAIDLARKVKDKYAEAQSFNELGFSYKNLGQIDTSDRCYSRAIFLWEQTGAEQEAVHAKFNKVRLFAHNFNPHEKIIPLYLDVINEIKEKKIKYWLDELYHELSSSYLFVGDSLNWYKYEVYSLQEVINKNNKQQELKLNDLKEKYVNDKIKSEFLQVTNNLHRSEILVTQKKRENLIISVSLMVLVVLIIAAIILAINLFRSNKLLSSQNKEKDVLIQEIHHRVKNNLQFVSSLINLQINSCDSEQEKISLNDASRRIKSMALVHEMLYNYQEISGIEIRAYLSELLNSLKDLVDTKNSNLSFNIKCESYAFDVTSAIALGMITSELVSNSIKHAFSNIENPQITIDLTKEHNHFKLVVRDNGSGFLEIKNKNAESLGLRLIDIFSRQLKGNYSFKNENGLIYTLDFNYV